MPETGVPTRTGGSDAELLVAFAARRDEAAFGELVQRYGPFVHAVCRRLLDNRPDAEDAAQAVFVVLARKAAEVGRVARLPDWLHHVAAQVALSARRARRRRQRHEHEAGKAMNAPPPAHLSPVEQAELRRVLDEELAALPQKHRLVVFHHYLLGRTQEETAALLGEKPGTVSMWLHRARERLKERLERRGVALSVLALAAFLSAEAGAAELPASFVQATVHAATAGAVAAAGSDALAAPVAELVEGALKAMFYAKLKAAAAILLAVSLVASSAGVALWQARAADGPQGNVKPVESPTPAKDPSQDGAMAKLVEGEKALVLFWHDPVVAVDPRVTPAQLADGRKAIGDEIGRKLKDAGVETVRFVGSEDGLTPTGRFSYQTLMLLDCKSQRPEKALADVPYRVAGIVFRNGQYDRPLPAEKVPARLIVVKNGQIPVPYAYYFLGGSAYANILRGKEEVERFKALKGVHVEALPPSGASGSGWSARLTPAPGHTLLEVFLLTGAGFRLVDPPAPK